MEGSQSDLSGPEQMPHPGGQCCLSSLWKNTPHLPSTLGSQPCSRELSPASRAPGHLLPSQVLDLGVAGALGTLWPSRASWFPGSRGQCCWRDQLFPSLPEDLSLTLRLGHQGRHAQMFQGQEIHCTRQTARVGPRHTHTAADACLHWHMCCEDRCSLPSLENVQKHVGLFSF